MSWDNTLPYMLKAENMVEPSAKQSTEGRIDPTVHGHQGKLSVSAPYLGHLFNEMLNQFTRELKDGFPFKLDMNDGRPIGFGWSQFSIYGNGERSSAATAYLRHTRANVHVLVNAHVTRVLPTNSTSIDFRTVEFAQSPQHERETVTATKEVILSAGVVATPHILLDSGIGGRQELEELGIETLVDNPSVGRNLTDHPLVRIAFETTVPDTDYNEGAALEVWNGTRRGPMAMPHRLNHIIWVRLPLNATPFSEDGFADLVVDMPNSPHIEMVLYQISSDSPSTPNGVQPVPEGIVTLQLLVSSLNPVSRGSVGLRTSDPFTEVIRSARRLYSAPIFRDSVLGTALPGRGVVSDEDLDAYIRNMTTAFTHGAGSAAMSPRGASWGVVDPDFRVKGTRGLRVVHASVLPSIPSGHTQAPVYAVAEWASAVVRNS